MADESLKDPITVTAVGINAASLPVVFSPAYRMYVLSQSLDFTRVTGKANEAGQGAYDAQVKNEEQDLILIDHEHRIQQLRIEVDNHELRITANTNAIQLLDVRLTTSEGQIVTLRSDVDYLTEKVVEIEGDMVSKSAATDQVIQSAGGSFIIGNAVTPTTDKLQVVGNVAVSSSYKVKHSVTVKFTRPVVMVSNGDTKLQFTGAGNQIVFGPDGITFNGENGGIDHKLHVTYGFVGKGIFTFTGDLKDHGIVFNEYVTNPRVIGLRFINYGSEDYYEIKIHGQCWDITVDNIRHSNTQSKAVNFLSANGKMKDGTVDYGNSRLHIGSDVYLQIEGTRSGGVCIDVGGADYRFDGVAQGWKITHQLGAFAFNPRINGYHETIYPECECLITYGGIQSDSIVPDDHYFKGGLIGGNGIYWNAHNINGPEGYPATNCKFMMPGRDDVVLINCLIDNIDIFNYDTNNTLVTTNIITGRPSYGNGIGKVNPGSVKVHDIHSLINPWESNSTNYVLNGSGFLSREGSDFIVNGAASSKRLFDFFYFESTGGNTNCYRTSMYNNAEICSDGTAMTFVVSNPDGNDRYLHNFLDGNPFKLSGKKVSLSFLAVNNDPQVKVKVQYTLSLEPNQAGDGATVFSFGEFDINPYSWGHYGVTMTIPYFTTQAAINGSKAILTLVFPKNQKVNLSISKLGLYDGGALLLMGEKKSSYELIAISKALYGE